MIPAVSIIVPVYNVLPHLEACLDTIRAQSLRDIEIICVDDCSTDGSSEVLKSSAKADPRIKIVTHPTNRGLSAARNTGIDEARAPWILFVDSDDLVSADICRRTLEVARANDADVVLFSYVPFRGTHCVPTPAWADCDTPDRHALLRFPNFAWTKLVSADLFKSRRIRFPEGYYFEDVPVHWQVILLARKTVRIDEIHVGYRQRAGSITYRSDWVRADSLRTYDLVRAWLRDTGQWDEFGPDFIRRELINFANVQAYYSIANPSLLSRLQEEIRCRMTLAHWDAAMAGQELLSWQRNFLLARCRPQGVSRNLAQLPASILHASRDCLRYMYHRFKK